MAHKSIVDRVLMLAAAVCAAALVWQLTVLLTSKRTPSIGRAVAMSAPAAADDPAAPAPAAVAAVAPSPAVRIVYPGADTGKTSLKATDLPAAPLAALTTPAATVPASGFVQAAPASAGPPQDGASPPGLPSTQIVDGRPAQPAASAEGPGSTEPDQAGLTATRAMRRCRGGRGACAGRRGRLRGRRQARPRRDRRPQPRLGRGLEPPQGRRPDRPGHRQPSAVSLGRGPDEEAGAAARRLRADQTAGRHPAVAPPVLSCRGCVAAFLQSPFERCRSSMVDR